MHGMQAGPSNAGVMSRFLALPIAGLMAALSLCSCASVKVRDDASTATGGKAPQRIDVVPFSIAGASIREHPMRKAPGQLGPEASQLLADRLAAELSKHIAPARVVPAGTSPRRDTWLVTGRITRVSEGSRALRMLVGLGAGGTKMETSVLVRGGGSKRPLLTFGTSGGSGAAPGAITNPIPFSSGAAALLQCRLGVSDDAARTARVITNRLLTYLGRPPSAGVSIGGGARR